MTLSRGTQRAMIATFFAVLAAVYTFAWFLPAIGLDHDDALYLISAKTIAAGHGYTLDYPPFFPAVLALFTLFSQHVQWLKLLPLAATAGWLAVTYKLLLKMGASSNGALLLVGLTAASPTVVFLSANLLPESLFALLSTAALLSLLEDRSLLAGVFAGLATLTLTVGVALIAACILTLAARHRFRNAAVFAAVAMMMAAPWLGWSLAHVTRNTSGNYVPSDILMGLAANEKLVVLGRNLLSLFAAPFSLLTGITTTFAVVATIVILIGCFYIRRQLLPDLFVAFYCLALLLRIWPPTRFVAPILPLVLWIVWRVFRTMRNREAMAALILIAIALPIGADAIRVLPTFANGVFALESPPPDNWNEMRKLFGFIRMNTAPGSILLANMDGAFFLHTGHAAIRGFTPNGFDLYYAARRSGATPDQLSSAILKTHVDYVVLTPDFGMPESASFHKSVEALERGGVVEPVDVPGAARNYSLFKVITH